MKGYFYCGRKYVNLYGILGEQVRGTSICIDIAYFDCNILIKCYIVKNVIKDELGINMMPNILFCKVNMTNIGLCGSIENLILNL